MEKVLVKKFKKTKETGLAAEQAYYYMLSLFPMLILLISIVPYLSIKPEEAIHVLQSVMPGETAAIFKDNVAQFVSQPNGGLLTRDFRNHLVCFKRYERLYPCNEPSLRNVKEQRSFIKVRGLSILLTIGLIVTIVVSLLLPVFGGVLLNWISEWFSLPSGTTVVLNILRWIIGVGIMVLVLSVLYRLAPNKTFPFAHVWPGALAATLLWQLTSLGFSFYVSNFGNYSATYGSLGGVIVLMLWLFLTGLILVIGGEINAIYHRNKTAAPPKDTSQAM